MIDVSGRKTFFLGDSIQNIKADDVRIINAINVTDLIVMANEPSQVQIADFIKNADPVRFDSLRLLNYSITIYDKK